MDGSSLSKPPDDWAMLSARKIVEDHIDQFGMIPHPDTLKEIFAARLRYVAQQHAGRRGMSRKQPKDLGERSREELAAMFGQMYAGWDRGMNMEGPDTKFRETPMTAMELEARYVAAEIGVNIYEIANSAAFAPIVVYQTIQKFLGPVFADLERRAAERAQENVSEWQPMRTEPRDGNFRLYGLTVNYKEKFEYFEVHYLAYVDGEMIIPGGDNFSDWSFEDFEVWAAPPQPPPERAQENAG